MGKEVPCTTLVPILQFCSRKRKRKKEKNIICRNAIFFFFLNSFQLPLRYQLPKITNSQNLSCHTTTHNSHKSLFHWKSDTFIRCILTSSWKWLPQIFCCVQYSQIYFICLEPRLFSSIWAGAFFVPGYRQRRCNSAPHGKSNTSIRCVSTSSWKRLPWIFCCVHYSHIYFICRETWLFSSTWAGGFFVSVSSRPRVPSYAIGRERGEEWP